MKKFNVLHVATAEGMQETAGCCVACNPVSVIFIPADASAAISSIAVSYADDDADLGGAVGCVTKFANAHFAGTGERLKP